MLATPYVWISDLALAVPPTIATVVHLILCSLLFATHSHDITLNVALISATLAWALVICVYCTVCICTKTSKRHTPIPHLVAHLLLLAWGAAVLGMLSRYLAADLRLSTKSANDCLVFGSRAAAVIVGWICAANLLVNLVAMLLQVARSTASARWRRPMSELGERPCDAESCASIDSRVGIVSARGC